MATRKVKRYNGDESSMTSEDVASFAGTPENESNAGMKEAYEEPEAPKKTTFKEAFAAARKAGDKSFQWEGKKYTTEMAGEKKAAPKAEPKKELKYQSLSDRSKSYEAERAKTGVGMYGTRTGKAAEYDAMAKAETSRLAKENPPTGKGRIETRNLNKDTLLPKMAKGGDVKGWGAARGARKAKIY